MKIWDPWRPKGPDLSAYWIGATLAILIVAIASIAVLLHLHRRTPHHVVE